MSPTTKSAAPVLTAQEQLHEIGFTILRRAMSPEIIAAINSILDPTVMATPFCKGDFYGPRTKRLGRLLARAERVADLAQHPEVLELVEAFLAPWCDCIQLNLTQLTEVHPGAPAQFPHRDQDMWRGPTGEIEYLVNVIWPLTPFTASSGATLIWPQSASARSAAEAPAEAPLAAEAEPGDAIIFLGSTLHGAGANVTNLPRRGLIVSYCLGWLKPYENQWLAYPPEIARRFSPELAALVGYRQHRPNLGNFEGQCPSILLHDDVPDAIAAEDALRPDQADMLRAFVRAQQAEAVEA